MESIFNEMRRNDILISDEYDCTYQNSPEQDIDFIHSFASELPDIQFIEEPEWQDKVCKSIAAPQYSRNEFFGGLYENKPSILQSYLPFSERREHISSYCSTSMQNPEEKSTQLVKFEENQLETTTLCPICHEGNAGKHKHYGGKACASCRAFFRRSVENEAYKKFKCIYSELDISGNYCLINSRSWISCRYCRFQKCLSSGLKVSLVLTPYERELRKKKRYNKRREECAIRKGYNKSYFSSPNPSLLSNTSFANEEVALITYQVNQLMTEYMHKDMAKFLVENPSSWNTILKMTFIELPNFDINDLYNKQKTEALRRSVFERFLCDTYIEHSALSPSLVEKLFNHNMPTANFIVTALNIGNSVIPSPLKELLQDVYERRKYLSTYLPHTPSYQQEMDLMINQSDEKENYNNCITILAMRVIRDNIEMTPHAKALNFEQAYQFQSLMQPESKELKTTFTKNLEQVGKWPTFPQEKNKDVKQSQPVQQDRILIDYVLITLMIFVSLYGTNDGLNESIDCNKVEKLQHQHLTLLHKYLKFSYPERANNLLASGISVISKAQTACKFFDMKSELF